MTNQALQDSDPQETQEWLDALAALIKIQGKGRTRYLLDQLADYAQQQGVAPQYPVTAYVNTIRTEDEQPQAGDIFIEQRIRSLIRWNAMALVVNASRREGDLGGHLASFASAAALYEVGFNHFFHGANEDHGGDLIFFQGHSAPGIYARAFLEGRLTEQQMYNYREESAGFGTGLSSYPHPRLMPDFWQFPTVSMGLGPLTAIYQAKFLKYLQDRQLADTQARKVWAFIGDGETDEPETLGAIHVAGREKLDNLIFVINCNLQRLDGPVRGNSKIIQELEGMFRGAGWNVIKLIWGGLWDPLLAKDNTGKLKQLLMETVDGEYQAFKYKGGAYTREQLFGKYPETLAMVEHLSDEDIFKLDRGGHDPQKVYAAYHAAVHHQGQPTVILAHTVKGYGMSGTEAENNAHNVKKLDNETIKAFRDRFNIPITDAEVTKLPFYRPAEDSPELVYLKQRRQALGGSLPARRTQTKTLAAPDLKIFNRQLKSTGKRQISNTMAFMNLLSALVKDKALGTHIVPIVPDEARSLGMDGLFQRLGIYSQVGQLYPPMDANQLVGYKESKQGVILQEGISEAGAFSTWLAAATSYSVNDLPLIPFYVFYSMFGFQRIGDLCWLAGDMRARGFLIGGLSGRTSLPGEGLQHNDGHSQLLANTVPCCISYDPAYSYEVAVIVQDGIKRMYQQAEDVFYYLTLTTETYHHPDMPEGAEEGIIKGIYLLKPVTSKKDLTVQLLGSGAILREVEAAAQLLEADFKVAAQVWSVTSFNELARQGQDVDRWNLLNPEKPAKQAYVTECLADAMGPVIAASDYMRVYAEQIRAYMPTTYKVLGTDGFSRSDTREALRRHFEVDRYYIVVAALKALADEGKIPLDQVSQAIAKFNLDTDKPNPATL
jgi:pyruvate dehydrogenase E1 component